MGSTNQFSMGSTLIYGGAFNPIHRGHTAVVKSLRKLYPECTIQFTPSANHPHAKEMTPFHHRYEMCRLALEEELAGDAKVTLSDVETRNPTGRTFELLKLLSPPYAIVIGSDNALEFETWFNYRDLIDQVPFIVLPRTARFH